MVACKRCLTHVSDEIRDHISKKSQAKEQLNLLPDCDEMDADEEG